METKNVREPMGDEANEIMSIRPHWIVRKGSALFFFLFIAIMFISWFIRYPDVVGGSVRLMASAIPKEINARVQGKLEKILVRNDQEVTQGQILAFVQSTGKHEQVLKLKEWVQQMVASPEEERITVAANSPLPALFNLGELQSAYQQFQNVLQESKQILTSGYYEKKKSSLEGDLAYLSQLQANTIAQQKLIQENYELQKIEYGARESLMKDKVIAPLELYQDRYKLIAKEQSLQQGQAALVNGEISIHNKQKEILDLGKAIVDQRQKFQSSLLELKSEVEDWVQQYILVAPETGKVLFPASLQENQLLSQNELVFYIQPRHTFYHAELLAGQKGFGKINIGQKVMIKLESFPSGEFGYIAGKVEHISDIPNRRDSFLVSVSLPMGLQTVYNHSILFRNNLSGQGEIITNNRRLFNRLAGEISKVFE